MNVETRVAATVGGHAFEAHAVLEPDASRIVDAVRALAMDSRRRYPGPNPVSLERASFDVLRRGDYVVCEKTDGSRFALVCLEHASAQGPLKVVALVDRKFSVFLFPLRNVPNALFQGTVLDGELAWDKVAGRFAYLAFDAVAVSGVPVAHAGLEDRLRAARAALEVYSPDPADPATVEVKTFVSPTSDVVGHLAAAAERFDVDGVVFTPVHDPVEFGRASRVFKLKTGHASHTVDFLVQGGGLHVYDGKGGHVRVGRVAGCVPAPNGSIVEAHHAGRGDPACDLWFVKGVRADKTTANDLLTYDKTMLNAREGVRLDEALAALTTKHHA
jgi:hypothetical protein